MLWSWNSSTGAVDRQRAGSTRPADGRSSVLSAVVVIP
jgi:hypothetical protein